MAKVNFNVAVAAAPQTGSGPSDYDATLDAVTTSLSGDPNGTDDGLILGDAGSGIFESGLTLGVGRRSSEKAPIAGSFTRGLSDFLALEVPTLSFAFPWGGSKRTTTVTTPVDSDFAPIRGVEAILNGAGLVSAAWGAGVGHQITPDFSANPFSMLIYYFGNRLELLNCRCSSLAINYVPGQIPIATATVAVGSVKDPSAQPVSVATLPSTLDYGAQLAVSAVPVETVGFSWAGGARTGGFSELTITITPTIADIADSNAVDGVVKEVTNHVITASGTIYADDAGSQEVYELNQMLSDNISDLDALSFTVGTAETSGSLPATAHYVEIPDPEVQTASPVPLGTKAANTIEIVARGATANSEFEMRLI